MDLNKYSEMTDQTLTEEVKKGNGEASGELVRRYVPLVKKLCQLNEAEWLKEDLEQELWIAFLELIERYDPIKAKFSTMAKEFLRGRRKNFLKKEFIRGTKENGTEEELRIAWEKAVIPGGEWECDEMVKAMQLTEKQSRILSLLEEGYAIVEIARILCISHPVVVRQVSLIRKKAKKIFE